MVLVVALLALGITPASAGTPADPEVTDLCGVTSMDDSAPLTPWTDVCSAWLDVDGTTVTASVKLAADVTERPNPSNYGLSWTTDDGCENSVGLGDRSLTDYVPELPNSSISGDEGFVSFAVICPIPEICDAYGCYDREWRAYQRLEPSDVTEAGDTISFTISLTGDLAPITDQYQPGQSLRGLTAETGVDCALCMIYSDETAAGRTYVIG